MSDDEDPEVDLLGAGFTAAVFFAFSIAGHYGLANWTSLKAGWAAIFHLALIVLMLATALFLALQPIGIHERIGHRFYLHTSIAFVYFGVAIAALYVADLPVGDILFGGFHERYATLFAEHSDKAVTAEDFRTARTESRAAENYGARAQLYENPELLGYPIRLSAGLFGVTYSIAGLAVLRNSIREVIPESGLPVANSVEHGLYALLSGLVVWFVGPIWKGYASTTIRNAIHGREGEVGEYPFMELISVLGDALFNVIATITLTVVVLVAAIAAIVYTFWFLFDLLELKDGAKPPGESPESG